MNGKFLRRIKISVPCWCGRFVKVKSIPQSKPHCDRAACVLQAVQHNQVMQQAEVTWRQAWREAQS